MSEGNETKKIVVAGEFPALTWPHLVVVEGLGKGRAYRLSQSETVIGRAAGSGVLLESDSVSRRHALVRITAQRLIIEDLGSRNGTFVGVDRIKGARELSDGDEITVGDTILLQLRYSVALEGALQGASYAAASRDPLTGLLSAPHFLDRLRAEYGFARRHGTPLVMGYFRADARGRLAAVGAMDDILQVVATIFRRGARAEDVVARTAENELMILLRRPEKPSRWPSESGPRRRSRHRRWCEHRAALMW